MGHILDLKCEILDRLQGQALIGYLQSEGISLRRSGSEFKMLCPFHDDHSPSFCINPNKRPGGIFKCWSCGWGASTVIDFIGEYKGIKDFTDRVRYIARGIGLDTDRRAVQTGAPVVKRERVAPLVETMTPVEVLAVYQAHIKAQLPAADYCKELGVKLRAMELAGGIVAHHIRADGGQGPVCLVMPMRGADGTLTSVRFRDFATKKRWSADIKSFDEGEWKQVKASNSGVMAVPEVFDEERDLEGTTSFVIEGETDLLGAISMLIEEFDEEPAAWPFRFHALPGVNAIHDVLLASRLSKNVITFFDGDHAGLTAVFWHRRMRAIRDKDHTIIGMEKNLDEPAVPGLLQKLRDKGHSARAAFPPKRADGKKFDLREMCKAGWRWTQFYQHVITTATADAHGARHRKELL